MTKEWSDLHLHIGIEAMMEIGDKGEMITNFVCRNCGHKWKGAYIPLYCPNCEKVLGIAIDITEEKDDGNDSNRKTQS